MRFARILRRNRRGRGSARRDTSLCTSCRTSGTERRSPLRAMSCFCVRFGAKPLLQKLARASEAGDHEVVASARRGDEKDAEFGVQVVLEGCLVGVVSELEGKRAFVHRGDKD